MAFGIAFLTFLLTPTAVPAASAPGRITLAWDGGPTTDITGYKLYYGTTSRQYQGSLSVGLTNRATITGLSAGTTYFFSATAVDRLGQESTNSMETFYTVLPSTRASLQLTVTPAKQVVLTGKGPAGYTYQVLGGSDLARWVILSTVVTDAAGRFQFVDGGTSTLPLRYYRLRQTSP